MLVGMMLCRRLGGSAFRGKRRHGEQTDQHSETQALHEDSLASCWSVAMPYGRSEASSDDAAVDCNDGLNPAAMGIALKNLFVKCKRPSLVIGFL